MMTVTHKIVLVLVLTATVTQACTIPVFRYALDRWPADSFAIAATAEWKTSAGGKKAETIISESDANLLWCDPAGDEPGPHLIWSGSTAPAWPEVLKAGDLDAMVSSPARDMIAERVLAGECAVWVMVDSGDQDADTAFAKRLKKRLKYLESVAAIPPQDPDDPDSRLGPGPDLKVGFSMIRVKRDDPKERFLVPMLAGANGRELLDGKAPFAAPVFARGRVLGAWTADDLDDAGIDEVSLFLLGACSCRVKALNPGWDLLMTIDWDEKLMEVEVAKGRAKDETPSPSAPPEPDDPAPAAESR